MKRSIITLVLTGLLGAAALTGIAPAAAAPAATAITQHPGGVLLGRHEYGFGYEWDRGEYANLGQLGRGAYYLNDAGAATFTRSSDHASLTGHVTGTSPCDRADNALCYKVDLTGVHDVLAARLILKGGWSRDAQDCATYSGSCGPSAMKVVSSTVTLRARVGYALLEANGHVHALGGIDHHGDAPRTTATHLARTPSGAGYWIVNAGGAVFPFGDAHSYGNANRSGFVGGEIVSSLSATSTGHGYWLFTNRGRALPFGDAKFYGDMHAAHLNGPVVNSVVTPSGHGYYMLGSDGGIFGFGDAKFHGSMGGKRLNKPIFSIVPTPTGAGYWLIASDGGVFGFGDAKFRGSLGSAHLARPITAAAAYGNGYVMFAGDGGTFSFSNKTFFGSATGQTTTAVVGGTAIG